MAADARDRHYYHNQAQSSDDLSSLAHTYHTREGLRELRAEAIPFLLAALIVVFVFFMIFAPNFNAGVVIPNILLQAAAIGTMALVARRKGAGDTAGIRGALAPFETLRAAFTA